MPELTRLVIATVAPLTMASIAMPSPAQTHTHGDMAGTITHDSAIVWTRASQDAVVSVLYATNPSLSGAREVGFVTAGASTDFTAKVALRDLAANTRYYYATRLRDPSNAQQWTLGAIGKFRTAPAPGTSAPVTLMFSGDVRNLAEFDLFPRMQAENADFYVSLGDFPYADGARTIQEYRAKHYAIRSSPLLWAFQRSTPCVAIWDDHEVVNNWDAATDAELVRNGIAVFHEMFPIPDGLPEIYRARRWGDALDLFLLDDRSHRGVNSAPDLASRPMLGRAQLDWLENELSASTATFKVIATSVPLRYSSTTRDAWNGYMHERQELLGHITRNRIANVVFITADQHFAASHQHRDGVREFQAGPIATSIGSGRPFPEPEVIWRGYERNYGMLRIDTAANPRTMTVEWRGLGGPIRREVFPEFVPARLSVGSDAPETTFRLDGGPFLYRGSGQASAFPLVQPGVYRIAFGDLTDAPGRPADLGLTVPGGGDVRVRGDYRDVEVAAHEVLLADGFAGPLAPNWTAVDETAREGPSSWFTDSGYLYQSSNINGPGDGIDQPGTLLVGGDPRWQDYTASMRLLPHDNDAVGAVFRYSGPNDYYRFSMDLQRGYRRLVSKRGGVFRVLAQSADTYAQHRWHALDVVAVGQRLRVRLDGEAVFDVVDSDHASGKVGMYAWASHLTAFDDLIVRAGDALRRSRVPFVSDDFDDRAFTGWTVVDTGTSEASRWSETGGTLHQTSNINDGAASLAARGTVALKGPAVIDHDVLVNLRNGDDDALGVVFRWTGANDHYRFSIDAQRHYRRLAKVVAGQWTLLWQDAARGYDVGAWHRVHVRAVGSEIVVRLDGTELCRVTDVSHAAGRAGLYCWASDDAEFEDFVGQQPATRRPVLASVLDGRVTSLVGRAPASAGQPYLLALSFTRSPGIPLSLLDPLDPRVLELTPDWLFLASLQPNPLMSGFIGTVAPDGGISASIAWPNLPGLSGTLLHAGGWTIGPGRPVDELLQSVELVIP